MSTEVADARPTQVDQRHRSLLRTLHARLFVSVEGRVFVARGKPDPAKLRSSLAGQLRAPTAAEAPSPLQLGLELCDGEIPEPLWHEMRRAHKRWSLEHGREWQRRPARRRANRVLVREGQELQHLARRLAISARWRSEFVAGREPAGAPYLLDDATEEELQRMLPMETAHCPPLVAWMARVVCWLAGPHAARRFVLALAPHLPALNNPDDGRRLRQFIERLQVWKARSRSEPFRSLQAEMKQAIGELRPHLVKAGGLTARLRGRTIAEHCDHLLRLCHTLASQQGELIGSRLPGVLAAWAACDSGTAPLPQRLIAPAPTADGLQQLERAVDVLIKESGERGYDALLAALDYLDPTPGPHSFGQIRALLVRGASLADVAWCGGNGLLRWLSSRGVLPGRLRHMIGELERRSVTLSADEHLPVAELLATAQGQNLLTRWLRWLDQPVSRAWPQKLRQRIRRALMRTLHWGVRQKAYIDCLIPWFQPPEATLADLPADLAAAARRPIERLAAYQQLGGIPFVLPNSIRRLIDDRGALERECNYLHQRVTAGKASPAMYQRWQALESRLITGGVSAGKKLARSAEETLVTTALQALPVLIRRAAEAKWREFAGVPPLELPLERLLGLVDWGTSLSDEQNALLRSLLAAWHWHGPQYKRHLPGNAAWLTEAAKRGLDVAAWLAPPSESGRIGETDVQVGTALDPREVFHMGDYFRTCLSLEGGQQASVLANAHDANKHVVLLTERGRQRHVLGRQLIAITAEGTLLGYHCYVGWDNKLTEPRHRALELMATYCGRLARRCGLTLADEGKPLVLSPVDWWDDGVWAWHAAARQAWSPGAVPSCTEPLTCGQYVTLNGLENPFAAALLQSLSLTAAAGPETTASRNGLEA